MRITALQPQATVKDRINIFADGAFFMGTHALIVFKLELKIGQELTHELIEQLRYEEDLQKALDRALNYLSFRPRSRMEIINYLHKKETPAILIDPILEKLAQMDLINDEAFASFWIESRGRFRPKGARAIKQELRMKGLTADIVDDVVNDDNDDTLALEAGRKKAWSLMRQPDIDFQTFRSRLGSFLQRRGFDYATSSRTVRTLWKEFSDMNENET